MVADIYTTPAHFMARITILTAAHGGRQTPPHNYIRWDFGYPEDAATDPIFMIYPNFLDDGGTPIPKGVPLEGSLNARMHIIPEPAVVYHRARIHAGMAFNCHEGRRVVATGVVTKLLALNDR
jgi:hypothetical protein